ncbi:MAG: AMP-binding protein [Pseudomonadota bacterium]
MDTTGQNLDTIPKLLRSRAVGDDRNRIAMRKKDYGIWNEFTWADVYEHVKNVSNGLLALGFEKGDKVTIIGDNDPEWLWAEWAAQCLRGAALGVYIDSTPPEVKYYVEHSDSSFVFARDQEQVDKILEIYDELPKLKRVIYWDPRGLWFQDPSTAMDIRSLEKLGRDYAKEQPEDFQNLVSQGKADDVAVYCYTSGTTGKPKGAMLSHRNLLFAVRALDQYNAFKPGANYLSYISPAWITEQFLALCGGVWVPLTLHFPEKPETVQLDIRDIAPEIVFYGARLWESLASTIQVKISDSTRLKMFLYKLASRVGHKRLSAREQGKRTSPLLSILHRIADFAVFRPLRDRIGFTKNKVAYTAGAAIAPDMMRLFHAAGINIKNLYGSTEASLVSLHKDDDVRYETIGVPFEGCDVKISPEGEILVKSEGVFIGYHKNPEATSKVIRDGYYCTGDAGLLDRGHLVYLDRLAEMIELSDGKTFSPQYTEIRLRFSPYCKDAVVFGGRNKPFVTAILNIDYDNVGKWAEREKIGYTTYMDLSQKKEVRDLLKTIVENVNAVLPEYARIRAFVSLHKEFDADEAELTRTRKLKREPIEERYKDVLQGMYEKKENIKVESQVVYRDGRTGTVKTEVIVNHLN